MKRVINSGRVPIKMWLTDMEPGAIDQAKNLSNLPFAFKHVAVMPDCLSEDTEILTSRGFIPIKEIDEETLIVNYEPELDKCFFDTPKNLIVRDLRYDEDMYEFTIAAFDKSIKVTSNHRMPYINKMGIYAKDLPNTTYIEDYIWSASGYDDNGSHEHSDELICLIAWIVGDGNIKYSNKRVDGSYGSVNIRFGFTKERKIKRVINLLDSLGYKYSVSENTKQTTISIMVEESRNLLKYVTKEKIYPIEYLSSLDTRQALIFLEECIKVDGDWVNYLKYNHIRYNSKRQSDINFLSALISLHFGVASDHTRWSEGFDTKIKMHGLSVIPHKHLKESPSGLHKSVVNKQKIEYKGKVVCVTCESGWFIARQNGMTFISGNSHQGYGMPIGAILATKGVVIPNAVGVDIGCGMVAAKTSIPANEPVNLKKIFHLISARVPVGMNRHKQNQDGIWMPSGYDNLPKNGMIRDQFKEALKQVGTLGGGNHFIEVQEGDDGYLWIMIHSGSRNLGYKTAAHHNTIAKELNKKHWSEVPPSWGLAFLPMDSDEGQAYLSELDYATRFAENNRRLMFEFVRECFADAGADFNTELYFNKPHNFAEMENHYGENVMVHRKGACRVREDEWGMIPGSQGTHSYIVKGLGNAESFNSCSHGAGRVMSRKRAINELSLEDEKATLDNLGVIHSLTSEKQLDEAPSAYKNIGDVMNNQLDLVSVQVKLRPRLVVKA